LFCGTNASGKSSVIQTLLLLAQNHSLSEDFLLNGDIINLGEYKEIKNFDSGMDTPIELCIVNDNNDVCSISFLADSILERTIDFQLINQKNIFYLSANRIGNSDVFEKSSKKNIFGSLGEYAVGFLNDNKDFPMPQKLIFDLSEETAHSFIDEVNYWMKRITGSTINIDNIERTNKLVLSYKNSTNKLIRNSNTGSGLSFVISIIILALGVGYIYQNDNNFPTVIIENPEIHLHPKAQSALSDFLSWISNFMQIIIETHSDHIFNGYRRSLKSEILNVDNSKLYFFSLNGNSTNISKINFTQSGKVLTLEKDLFDQFQLDISKLLGR